MSILNTIFKNKPEDAESPQAQPAEKKATVKKVPEKTVKAEKKTAPKSEAKSETKVVAKASTQNQLKGKSQQADRVLIKPLVTEKAATLASGNKYFFAVSRSMNKIEVKKAIRAIYGVDPAAVHVVSVSGKLVRYGRNYGKTKDWKKAIVTLKPGDKIEIYEGV